MKIEELNLSSLKYFLDAVKHESLTRSAEANFITRPAVSLAIKRLEVWYGKALLTHEKNVFALTQAGQEFYRKMLPVYEQLKSSLENEVSSEGPIRIGCSTSLVDQFLLPHLKSFKNLSGLRLSTGRASELLRSIEEGNIRLAILIGEGPGWPHSHSIHEGEFVLCSKSGDLGKSIVTTEPRPEVTELQRALHKKRLSDVALLRVESWSIGLKVAATLNCGCLVPDFLVGSFKKVKAVPFKYPYRVSLVHRNMEQLSENEVKLFTSFTSV